MNNSELQTIDNESDNSLKTYLFTNENFNLLRNAQKLIKLKTGFSPSIRKLVNEIVNNESINKTVTKFIENLQ